MIEFTYGAKDENKAKSRCDRAGISSGFIHLYDKQGVNYGAISLGNDIIIINSVKEEEVSESEIFFKDKQIRKSNLFTADKINLETNVIEKKPTIDELKAYMQELEIERLQIENKGYKEIVDKLMKIVLQ